MRGNCGVTVHHARVVAELDLEHIVAEVLDDGTHLASNEALLVVVHQQGDHVKDSRRRGHGAPRGFQYNGRRRAWATASTVMIASWTKKMMAYGNRRTRARRTPEGRALRETAPACRDA